jgi:hypothetical protein
VPASSCACGDPATKTSNAASRATCITASCWMRQQADATQGSRLPCLLEIEVMSSAPLAASRSLLLCCSYGMTRPLAVYSAVSLRFMSRRPAPASA